MAIHLFSPREMYLRFFATENSSEKMCFVQLQGGNTLIFREQSIWPNYNINLDFPEISRISLPQFPL